MNNHNIATYTLLAEAAYANFSGLELNVDEQIKQAIIDISKKENTDPDHTSSTVQFADHVINHYEVKAHYQDRAEGQDGELNHPESGFSATLFQTKPGTDNNAGEYVLAIRGTRGSKDLVATDGGDIVRDGVAYEQIIDLYNFWQQLNSTGDYRVARAEIDWALTGTGIRNQAAGLS